MDVELANHLLRKVSSALLRYGTPPPDPAPKLTSWEEFLRQPTAAERAAADAHERERPTPPDSEAPDPARSCGSRRRRRRTRHAPAAPPKSEPPTERPRRATKADGKPSVPSLAQTYDVTAAGSSTERIGFASAPRRADGIVVERAVRSEPSPDKKVEPQSSSDSPAQPAAAVTSDELTAIRQLLEQLVRSQLRVESRLEAIERSNASRPPVTENEQRETAARVSPEPASDESNRPPEENVGDATEGKTEDTRGAKGEDLRALVNQLQASLLAVSRQLTNLNDRINGIEQRMRRPERRPSRRHRPRTTRPRSSCPPRINEERGPPDASAREDDP